jgi:Uncharacterized protein conserved in bacteria (DUF2252)
LRQATSTPDERTANGRAARSTISRDAIAIAAYRGSKDSFDPAMAEFAESYADQNERDHRALLDAIESGRVAAEIGR